MDEHDTDMIRDPNDSLRPGATGTVVVIDGVPWMLADYVPELGPLWDELYDQNCLAGRYDEGLLRAAGVRLLFACHDLTPDAAADLACRADATDLIRAVETALLGPETNHHGWTEWVETSLWSNGINPDTVPPRKLHAVLNALVATGRAVPQDRAISSLEAAALRRGLLALAKPKPTEGPTP